MSFHFLPQLNSYLKHSIIFHSNSLSNLLEWLTPLLLSCQVSLILPSNHLVFSNRHYSLLLPEWLSENEYKNDVSMSLFVTLCQTLFLENSFYTVPLPHSQRNLFREICWSRDYGWRNKWREAHVPTYRHTIWGRFLRKTVCDCCEIVSSMSAVDTKRYKLQSSTYSVMIPSFFKEQKVNENLARQEIQEDTVSVISM
jgi:hypothetical protein